MEEKHDENKEVEEEVEEEAEEEEPKGTANNKTGGVHLDDEGEDIDVENK